MSEMSIQILLSICQKVQVYCQVVNAYLRHIGSDKTHSYKIHESFSIWIKGRVFDTFDSQQ